MELINSIEKKIASNYVLQENLEAIHSSLNKVAESEAFRQATDTESVAGIIKSALTKHDKHFGVSWDDPESPQQQPKHEDWFSKLSRKNSGFTRVEVLEGNIGYIDFWGFDHVNEESQGRVAAAMALIQDASAIIFDLRKNGGGNGFMGGLISGYLFDKPTHLNSIHWKPAGNVTEIWSQEKVQGKKVADTPVYILTSSDTFSAAEAFAYYLKHLDRATIIGEATKGGANPWQYFPLGNGFKIAIPIAKAVNPITKTNWEGTGVKPDIETSREKAFPTAYRLALQEAKISTAHPEHLKEIQ
ncbi:S41 family peptidase [Microbulbifer sp. ANSA003]|uniref:S41 family peptidase n=1 Tax=Microbulbifer sp. ANSA003 TaxID=3243360 RepID=UPI0040432213